MVKAALSRRSPFRVLHTILRAGTAGESPAGVPDAVMVEAGPALPARLDDLRDRAPILLLRLPGLTPETGDWLDAALPLIDAVVLGGCADAGDLVRLGTRLSVAEALLDRPDGSVFTIAELAPAALLSPLDLAAARPRLAGLLWNGHDVGQSCSAAPDALDRGCPGEVVRTLLTLAGAALALPVYDGASDDEVLEREASSARRLGFSGKVAAHPGQVLTLARLFGGV